jgi:hypothetical protein
MVTLAILCVWRNLESRSALVYVSANIRTGIISSKTFWNFLATEIRRCGISYQWRIIIIILKIYHSFKINFTLTFKD